MKEYCREKLENGRCNRLADLILWGKFFPSEALGPRCIDCARKYVPTDLNSIRQWGVYDLRPTIKIEEEVKRLTSLVLELGI